ncbi:hypothetical protein HAX54_016998 [Datura stramonium]|uniref:Uncharacterized protein n=1 Tax=Datura stramonium TaxID=4076 RepID=A0ABS8UM60_DATST|nr:hypothetical protein [Datura stramonium]
MVISYNKQKAFGGAERGILSMFYLCYWRGMKSRVKSNVDDDQGMFIDKLLNFLDNSGYLPWYIVHSPGTALLTVKNGSHQSLTQMSSFNAPLETNDRYPYNISNTSHHC